MNRPKRLGFPKFVLLILLTLALAADSGFAALAQTVPSADSRDARSEAKKPHLRRSIRRGASEVGFAIIQERNESAMVGTLTRAFAALLVGLFLLGFTLTSRASDPYSTVVAKHLALETPSEAKSGTETEDPEIADLKRAVLEEVHALPPRLANSDVLPVASQPPITGIVVVPLALLPLITVAYTLRRRLHPLLKEKSSLEEQSQSLLVEDPSLAAFFGELRDGLNASATTEPVSPDIEAPPAPAVESVDPVIKFLEVAPFEVANLRKLFSEFRQAQDEEGRQGIILEFLRQTGELKNLSRPVEVRPFWLMISAVEGLLQQLSRNPEDITASVLGTVAGAVDLLERLCVRGVNPNLASEPPVKLLAVDDDPVSRLAVSFALKKAFNSVDLSPDGAAALELVGQETYDVIFLDVDMPTMDGYELCTRIRQSNWNRETPIVFVTRHGDFKSRAQAKLSGGDGLIAKPFLAFEITVKALTLALRGRLERRKKQARPAPPAPETAPASVPRAAVTHPPLVAPLELDIRGQQPAVPILVSLPSPSPGGAPFSNSTLKRLRVLRSRFATAERAGDAKALQDFLGEVYVRVHRVGSEAERRELKPILRLSTALEALLKKLLDHSKFTTPSTLHAVRSALDLLGELCHHAARIMDGDEGPVRILVVDDDPVARRAVCGAIQLVFGRPEDADSGEAALELARAGSFDLIFLDVLMPGIDGFAACAEIHKTDSNRTTPVVFVTSHDDHDARAKAEAAGGSGFIPKPVLSSQIKLVALTFILRAHLDSSQRATAEVAA